MDDLVVASFCSPFIASRLLLRTTAVPALPCRWDTISHTTTHSHHRHVTRYYYYIHPKFGYSQLCSDTQIQQNTAWIGEDPSRGNMCV